MKDSPKDQSASAVPTTISQIQLAELACRLLPQADETAEQVVRRALSIWEESGKLLTEGTGPATAKPSMTFDEVAKQGLLPSTREKTEVVGTGKGVEMAVRRFFDVMIAGYDPAMKGRLLAPEIQRENKTALKKLVGHALGHRTLTASQLALVQQFQNTTRKRTDFAVTPELIRELLTGADVGQPGFDL